MAGRRTPVILPFIYGEAQPENDAPANSPTILEAVRMCEKSVAETWHAAKAAGEQGSNVAQSMKLTWLACLPTLDSRHNVRIYVALIAWAQVQLHLLPSEVKTYAYLAQVALQALNTKGGKDGE